MKAGIIGLVVVIVIATSGLFFYNKYSMTTEPLPSRPPVDLESKINDQPDQNLAGNYITGMGADAFKNSTANKIVLFFYADWCPTCRPIDAEFKNNLQKIPAGVEIYRVNYNDQDTDEDEKALAAKYGVTYQHTFVQVDKDGLEITKWNGGGLDKLISSIK